MLGLVVCFLVFFSTSALCDSILSPPLAFSYGAKGLVAMGPNGTVAPLSMTSSCSLNFAEHDVFYHVQMIDVQAHNVSFNMYGTHDGCAQVNPSNGQCVFDCFKGKPCPPPKGNGTSVCMCGGVILVAPFFQFVNGTKGGSCGTTGTIIGAPVSAGPRYAGTALCWDFGQNKPLQIVVMVDGQLVLQLAYSNWVAGPQDTSMPPNCKCPTAAVAARASSPMIDINHLGQIIKMKH